MSLIKKFTLGLLLAAAVPVLAQTAAPTNIGTSSAAPKFNLVCMQSAIDKRDTAIASAFDTYATSVKSALTTRASALKNAWALTDRKARRDGIKTAWKTWSQSAKDSQKAMRSGKKVAWDAFYATRKTCGKGAAAEDATTHAADNAL